jgi:hypothetical protein
MVYTNKDTVYSEKVCSYDKFISKNCTASGGMGDRYYLITINVLVNKTIPAILLCSPVKECSDGCNNHYTLGNSYYCVNYNWNIIMGNQGSLNTEHPAKYWSIILLLFSITFMIYSIYYIYSSNVCQSKTDYQSMY